MDYDKRILINKYFDTEEQSVSNLPKFAKSGTVFFFLGILLLYLQQIDVVENAILISIILIFIGLFSFWLVIKPFIYSTTVFSTNVEDGDMDVWFLEDMHEIIKPRALEQLSINPKSLKDENIIIVPYPIYWELDGANLQNISRKQGTDGAYVYTCWKVQMLIVTENFISYYSCVYDWLNSSISEERTNEYFFDDIASVRNDIIQLDYQFIDNEELSIGKAKVFILSNMSGDKLTIVTDIPSLNVPEGYSNNLERLVKAIRILLRNRRHGEEIELVEKIENNDNIEFEVETTVDEEKKAKVFFHQQLRELYLDYNQENEEDD